MTKKWDRYKPQIISLYKVQNRPLREVKRIMEKDYGFSASTRAYRTRFDKWKVAKYNCQRRRSSFSTWSTESALSSPRMIMAAPGCGSPMQAQMASIFPSSYREPTSSVDASMAERLRIGSFESPKRGAFSLPVRHSQGPWAETSPITAPIDQSYLSFCSGPMMYAPESAPHQHGHYSDGHAFQGLNTPEFKAEYLKQEDESSP